MGGTGQSSGKRVRSRCVRESSFDVGTGHDRSRVPGVSQPFWKGQYGSRKVFPGGATPAETGDFQRFTGGECRIENGQTGPDRARQGRSGPSRGSVSVLPLLAPALPCSALSGPALPPLRPARPLDFPFNCRLSIRSLRTVVIHIMQLQGRRNHQRPSLDLKFLEGKRPIDLGNL